MDKIEFDQTELNQRLSAPDSANGGWCRDICQGIIMAYFLVMAVIYPFYAPGGYTRIGEVKYEFFRNVSLITLAVTAGIILLSIAVRRDREWIIRNYRRMSVTDWFVYGYFVAVMLSYLCSAYKEDALWGVEGWRMGIMTQMILVSLYFVFSRYYHCGMGWTGIWILAAAGVFVLGICNRYSVYPIVMDGQTEAFISTLGNINWFCGYWSVTAPIGIALYWCSDKIWIRIPAAVYSVIAMLSGVTQGSNSAYLVFGVLVLMLFLLSLGSSKRIYRFLELCMMFALSCLVGKFMLSLPNLRYNYMPDGEDGMSRLTIALISGNTAWRILLCALICYVFLKLLRRYDFFHVESYIEKHNWIKGIITAATVVAVCIAAVVILMTGGIMTGRTTSSDEMLRAEDGSDGGIGYRQVFDEDWGNGRGAAFNCGINAYRSMDTLHKIVGIGPDCFADYVYDIPELADRMADRFVNLRLTNAHNELLTLLVNTGVLGAVCYAGLFFSAFVRYTRMAPKQPLLYLCAVSILTYIMHNMVSFQQVLNTPYIFIVIGIGERLYRSTTEGALHG